MILVIDNYDSFTYNLVQLLAALGAEVDVRRNDTLTPEEALALEPRGIVVSPGPGTPTDAGISRDVIRAAAAAGVPLLGVCLGHQCIAEVYGGTVCRSPKPVHGKTDQVSHDGKALFAGIPSPFTATRYHSLCVDATSVPDVLEVTATTPDDVIMGLRHRELPIFGVQFHPESVLTPEGTKLLANFLDVTGEVPLSGEPSGAGQSCPKWMYTGKWARRPISADRRMTSMPQRDMPPISACALKPLTMSGLALALATVASTSRQSGLYRDG